MCCCDLITLKLHVHILALGAKGIDMSFELPTRRMRKTSLSQLVKKNISFDFKRNADQIATLYLSYYLSLSIGRLTRCILYGSRGFCVFFSRLWSPSLDTLLPSSGVTSLQLVFSFSMVTMMMPRGITRFAFVWLTSLKMGMVWVRLMRRARPRIFFPC